jgi:hypothetical protein
MARIDLPETVIAEARFANHQLRWEDDKTTASDDFKTGATSRSRRIASIRAP